MACRRCQQRRDNAKKALQNKNFKEAGKQIAIGAGEMAGILPKTAMPGKK